MELKEIIQKTSEGLVAIDAITQTINVNRRTREKYLPGVPTLFEKQFVEQLFKWWNEAYPADFLNDSDYKAEFTSDESVGECDVVFNTNNDKRTELYEWAIEYKYIRLIGNNGKNNDYGLAKAVSPYLKDRSLIHDIEKLRLNWIAQKKAVILYGFEYDFNTCDTAERKFSGDAEKLKVIREIRKVCKSVDPLRGDYSLEPLAVMLDSFLERKGSVKGPGEVVLFSGADRHPGGGKGRVVGWEVS